MGVAGNTRQGRGRSTNVFVWLLKLCFAGFGFVCLIYGGIDFVSHAAYSLNGHRTDATLIAQRTTCALEYQLANESDTRRDPMPCDLAEAAVKANPGRHVNVQRETFARVRYTLADGRVRDAETKLSASNNLSPTMPPGSVVPIVYTTANPADFRIALTMSRVAELMMVIGIGVLVLLFTFLGTGNRAFRPEKGTWRDGVTIPVHPTTAGRKG